MVDSNFAFIDPVSAVYYGGGGGGGGGGGQAGYTYTKMIRLSIITLNLL